MKISAPDYISSIKPYVPGKPIEELEREYGINNSIKLASNENPFGPSPKAVEAIQLSLKNLNRYPDGSGFYLIKKLSEKLKINSENIILGNGSDEIIGMLTRALLKEGDEAIIPNPSFLMYDIMVRSSGALPIYSPLKSFAIDLDSIKEKITSKCRMIFINNPNNPTGTIVLQNDFNSFIKSVPPEIVIVIDEAYIEFVRDKNCLNSIDLLNKERPIAILRTFSKVYGLAGLRIGYGIMPKGLTELLNRIRQPFNANSLAQVGAISALEDEDFFNKTISHIHKGLEWLYNELDILKINYFPTQTNFFLIDVKQDANDIFEKLLKLGIIVRSMRSYGYPNYIRVNVGLDAENMRLVEGLKYVLGKG